MSHQINKSISFSFFICFYIWLASFEEIEKFRPKMKQEFLSRLFSTKLFFIKAMTVTRLTTEDETVLSRSHGCCLFLQSDNCGLSLAAMLGWRWEGNRKASNKVLMLPLERPSTAIWLCKTATSSHDLVLRTMLWVCVCPCEFILGGFWCLISNVRAFCPVLSYFKLFGD